MEYLVVHFDEDRGVIIDSAPGAWRTNKTLILQAGTHIIELALPANYSPASIEIELTDTTPLQPYEITFTLTKPKNPPSQGRVTP